MHEMEMTTVSSNWFRVDYSDWTKSDKSLLSLLFGSIQNLSLENWWNWPFEVPADQLIVATFILPTKYTVKPAANTCRKNWSPQKILICHCPTLCAVSTQFPDVAFVTWRHELLSQGNPLFQCGKVENFLRQTLKQPQLSVCGLCYLAPHSVGFNCKITVDSETWQSKHWGFRDVAHMKVALGQ